MSGYQCSTYPAPNSNDVIYCSRIALVPFSAWSYHRQWCGAIHAPVLEMNLAAPVNTRVIQYYIPYPCYNSTLPLGRYCTTVISHRKLMKEAGVSICAYGAVIRLWRSGYPGAWEQSLCFMTDRTVCPCAFISTVAHALDDIVSVTLIEKVHRTCAAYV